MTRTKIAKRRAAKPIGMISADDLTRVRKERDRHTEGGGTWQAWDRILNTIEDCHRVQQEFANAEHHDDDRVSVAIDRWLPAGGTV